MIVASDFVASVVIPTRNRREDLRRALRSCAAQSVPLEVLVMDDGSTDGTVEMVRTEFPLVRTFQIGAARGPSFQRTEGAKLAAAKILFPIDDDAEFSTPRVVEQTLAMFTDDSIGAVAIPYLEPTTRAEPFQTSPGGDVWCVHAFVGAAHAIRRDSFLDAGGYREAYFNMGEEGDLCLRMLDMGRVVRLGESDRVIHHMSPVRSWPAIDRRGRANDLFFAWMNCPSSILWPYLAVTTLNGVVAGVRLRRIRNAVLGLVDGVKKIRRHGKERQPMSLALFRLYRRLKHRGPLRHTVVLAELEKLRARRAP